jgi:Helix-turn-helix domain
MSDRQEEMQRADGSNFVGPESTLSALPSAHGLGEPMTIEDVAALLGCSPWTVRQRYLKAGLPHLQASARGKLIFFREQIIAWVEKRQRQKGGIPR